MTKDATHTQPQEPSATLLAETLQRLGYRHSSPNAGHGQQVSNLEQALDWAFALEETRPFLHWLCEALDGNGGRPDGNLARWAGYAVLSAEEYEALEELKAKGFLNPNEARWDVQPQNDDLDDVTIEQLESDVASLETELRRSREQLRLLEGQRTRLEQSRTSCQKRTERLNSEIKASDSRMQELDLEMSNLSLRVDAAMKEATNTVGQLAEAVATRNDEHTEDPPYFLFQCRKELEEWHHVDDTMTSLLQEKFAGLYPKEGELRTEETPAIFRHPLPQDIKNVPFDFPDELRNELDRLKSLYPLTEQGYLDALLRQRYNKAKLEALQTELQRQNDDMTQESVAEERDRLRAEAQSLRESIEQIRTQELPEMWTTLADFQLRMPFLKEYFDETLQHNQATIQDSNELKRLLLQQFARRQILLYGLMHEDKTLRQQGHVVGSLCNELERKWKEVQDRMNWITSPELVDTGSESGLIDPSDEFMQLVIKSLKFSGDNGMQANLQGGNTLVSMESVKEAAVKLVESVRRGKEGTEQEIMKLEGQMNDKIVSSDILLTTLYEHAVTAKPLMAPKELYCIEDEIRLATADLGPKLQEATQIALEMQQPF
ncbi:uncharacterized protein SPPG_09276 [Spizellomyces punctatus DAOM BR117]|uniref:HAUS augmin-like complex subunit 3 N-terminal domain-containing protein n=1 Tax=Spizellomyces punctatus (strain DAOM BR117) TaxID=645134 RepID=A0A0L0HC99_SPIPD|nr:uncharacterized protein SPPG_09276 [Spizellomyces punctatus DAOM BR117]KNC99160.1 hypothetical protein SPPG_09276 [Spizellomyces punctatus DAOM BR117]|eukprot:XP_016607200.1 hypothetical protein SPPG_09276 [Spizellomyces punctatus DAOM BR117]